MESFTQILGFKPKPLWQHCFAQWPDRPTIIVQEAGATGSTSSHCAKQCCRERLGLKPIPLWKF